MVRVKIEAAERKKSVQVGFTGQRLTAYGGMLLWSGFLRKIGFHAQLREGLKGLGYRPKAHNALSLTDLAMGFIGGVVLGGDRLARIASLGRDVALHEVLGIKRMASQSGFTRFFRRFTQAAIEPMQQLHMWALRQLPSRKGGYTLDLDSTALIHEDGNQEGVRVGYCRKGFKPCLHPLLAFIAEAKMVAGYWLRSGNTIDASNATEFCLNLFDRLPSHIRISLVRADSGFYCNRFFSMLSGKGISYIVACALNLKIKRLCRYDDEHWMPTVLDGMEIQEVEWNEPGQRVILIRQRIKDRPNSGGKLLIDVPGYRFQALITSLSRALTPLQVWRTYNGRADCENRIRELGSQFAIRGLCCKKFWATEASHHLAITAYNMCVLFQRQLGLHKKVELRTLRNSLFCRAAVWSRPKNRPTLRIAIDQDNRQWWQEIIDRILCSLPPPLLACNAAEVIHT